MTAQKDPAPSKPTAIRYAEQLQRDLEQAQTAFQGQPARAGSIQFRRHTIVRDSGEYRIAELSGTERDVPLPDLAAAVIAVRNYVRSSRRGWVRDVWEMRTNQPGCPVLFVSRSAHPKAGGFVNLIEPDRNHPDAGTRRTGWFYRVKAIDLNAFSIDLEPIEVEPLYEGGYRWSDELD